MQKLNKNGEVVIDYRKIENKVDSQLKILESQIEKNILS